MKRLKIGHLMAATSVLWSITLAGRTWAQAPSAQGGSVPASSLNATGSATTSSGMTTTPTKAVETPASTSSTATVDPASLLPDLPPLPAAKATLIGGTIAKLDRVRDQMTVNVFGGGHVTVFFDPRTQVYLGTEAASTTALREGARVHFETILDQGTVFARTIRLSAPQAQGGLQGILLNYRADRGELTLRDAMSPTPVRVRLTSSTRLTNGDRSVSADSLGAGSLIAVKFYNQPGAGNFASEVSVLALPGAQYSFSGKVVTVDLSRGMLVLESATDGKTYEIDLAPSAHADDELHAGVAVTVLATFEGSRYVARDLSVVPQQAR
jgi:hypothetical protein